MCLHLVSKLCTYVYNHQETSFSGSSLYFVFQMQIFDYLIRASNAASLFQSEKEDLHDIAVVSNSHCKEFINSLLISSSFLFRARAVVV